ncbi:hypothetical protein Tco_1432555, partial [Tanacetum coccineum]
KERKIKKLGSISIVFREGRRNETVLQQIFMNSATDVCVAKRFQGNNTEREVANQDVHLPVTRPKLPPRFYYLFGKPTDTQGAEKQGKGPLSVFGSEVRS